MSKILQFESIGGASGDMILGALLALGAPLEELNEELKSLNVDPFKIVVDEVIEQGMLGVKARVVVEEQDHDHHGRHLSTILKLIEESSLDDKVKKEATDVFHIIGEAEAAIHGIDIEKIHFHEVGAMDSIIDIVGCCLAKHKLGIEEVIIRSLPYGHGTIECAHGTYPNPSPATLRILEGFPSQAVDEPFELVTPTGAALLKTWCTNTSLSVYTKSLKSSYSFGHRTLSSRPNLLRGTLYTYIEDTTPNMCEMVECNLDDTTPELIGLLSEKLFEAGALDVFTQPILMKKQRQGILLSVLIDKNNHANILDLIFRESTTFGIRFYPVSREILDRSFFSISTEYGDIRIKIGQKNNEIISASPEIEDCKKCAVDHNIAVDIVYRAAIAAWHQQNK